MDENRINARKQAEAQVITRAQQDPAFRQQLIADPKGTIAREMGITLPDSVTVEVVEETPSTVYLVLPRAEIQPGAQLSDAELENVAGGWSEDCTSAHNNCDGGVYYPPMSLPMPGPPPTPYQVPPLP